MDCAETITSTDRLGICLKGANISLVFAASILAYTQRGKILTDILTDGAALDFAVLTLFITLGMMGAIVYVFGTDKLQTKDEVDKISMLETVLGILGISIIGGMGGSPLFIGLSILATLLLSKKQISIYKVPVVIIQLLSILLLYSPGLSMPVNTLLLSLGMSCAILGTISLKSLIHNRAKGIFERGIMICALLIAFLYSPVTFIIFPIVAFFHMNYKSIRALFGYIPVLSEIENMYTFLMKKRKTKELFNFLLRATKVLVTVGVVSTAALYFVAWYTDNSTILASFGITVTDRSPIFIAISERIAYVIDRMYAGVYSVAMFIRPKNIGDYVLESVGIDPDTTISPNNMVKRLILIAYRGAIIVDDIIVFLLKIISGLVYVKISLLFTRAANIILSVIYFIFSKVLYVVEAIVFFITGSNSIVKEPESTVLEKVGGVLLYPFTFTKMLFVDLFGSSQPRAVPSSPRPQAGNALTAFYGLLINMGIVLLNGYWLVVAPAVGKDLASDKMYTFRDFSIRAGFSPVEIEIPRDELCMQYPNFYQKYFDLYSKNMGAVFAEIEIGGAYSEQPYLENSKPKDLKGLRMYTEDGICKPIDQGEGADTEKMFSPGAISPRFTEEEAKGIKAILQYFPAIERRDENTKRTAELKSSLSSAEKTLRTVKPEENFLERVLGWKKDPKKVNKKANRKYRENQLDTVDYHRQYYYNLYVLSQYFLKSENEDISGLVSRSVVQMFNQILPTNYSTVDDEYFKSIISIRTAIIKRELPFLTEKQSAEVFCKSAFYALSMEKPVEEEGFFLKGVSTPNILAGKDSRLYVTQEIEEISTDEEYVHFRSIVVTDPNCNECTFEINDSTGVNINIEDESTTVVSVSVDGTPIIASFIPEDKTGKILINIKIRKDLIKNKDTKVTVRMFKEHTALVHAQEYDISSN